MADDGDGAGGRILLADKCALNMIGLGLLIAQFDGM